MGRAGALLTVFLLVSCGGEDDLPAQMQTAVEDYLAGRVGLAADNMEVSVDALQVDGRRAQVEVTIAAADDAAAAMRMVYELEKRSGRWRVKPSPPVETAPPAAGGLPPGHPPVDAPDAGLPPGHPPLEGGGHAPRSPGNLSMQPR